MCLLCKAISIQELKWINQIDSDLVSSEPEAIFRGKKNRNRVSPLDIAHYLNQECSNIISDAYLPQAI